MNRASGIRCPGEVERAMSDDTPRMRAVTVHAYGGAEAARVEAWPIPEAGPGEVRVAVVASSLNPLDHKARSGELRLLMKARMPKVLGGDFSGTVSGLGAGVTGFTLGDEVFGCVNEFVDARGSHAEHCVVPADSLGRKPASVTHEQAASLVMGGLTAWQALVRHAGLRAGQRLLVLGGSGGIGTVAIQVGKALGAHVTATASAANLGLLRALGAEATVDYGAVDYATLPDRFDVVLDTVGESSWFHARPVLARRGLYLTVLPGPAAILGMALAPLFGQRVVMVVLKVLGPDCDSLAKLVAEGKVRPIVGRTLTLDEVPAALEEMRLGRRVAGKQVVRIR
jgi:NADPH:quinone reductase-like Zn-dependent oxidoreductase